VIGLALKPVFAAVGVFTAAMKLKKVRAIKNEILGALAKINADQAKSTAGIENGLLHDLCIKYGSILTNFLENEFSTLEQDLIAKNDYAKTAAKDAIDNFLYNPRDTTNLQTAKEQRLASFMDMQNSKMMKTMCDFSSDLCLKFFAAVKSQYPFSANDYHSLAKPILEKAAADLISGPINSAISVMNDGSSESIRQMFELSSNDYIPVVQTHSHYVFVCRSCLDQSKAVSAFENNLPHDNFAGDKYKNALGQDTLQQILTNSVVIKKGETKELARYLYAKLDNVIQDNLQHLVTLASGTTITYAKTARATKVHRFRRLLFITDDELAKKADSPLYTLLGVKSVGGTIIHLIGSFQDNISSDKTIFCPSNDKACTLKVTSDSDNDNENLALVYGIHVKDEAVSANLIYNDKLGWKLVNLVPVLVSGVNVQVYSKTILDQTGMEDRERARGIINLFQNAGEQRAATNQLIIKTLITESCDRCRKHFLASTDNVEQSLANVFFNGVSVCSSPNTDWNTYTAHRLKPICDLEKKETVTTQTTQSLSRSTSTVGSTLTCCDRVKAWWKDYMTKSTVLVTPVADFNCANL
jgi:hypothetical protein